MTKKGLFGDSRGSSGGADALKDTEPVDFDQLVKEDKAKREAAAAQLRKLAMAEAARKDEFGRGDTAREIRQIVTPVNPQNIGIQNTVVDTAVAPQATGPSLYRRQPISNGGYSSVADPTRYDVDSVLVTAERISVNPSTPRPPSSGERTRIDVSLATADLASAAEMYEKITPEFKIIFNLLAGADTPEEFKVMLKKSFQDNPDFVTCFKKIFESGRRIINNGMPYCIDSIRSDGKVPARVVLSALPSRDYQGKQNATVSATMHSVFVSFMRSVNDA